LGGLISKLRTVPIRSGRNAGKKIVIAMFEDFAGSVEAVIFSEQLAQFQHLLKPDAVVFIDGSVDRRREEASVRVSNIVPIEEARQKLSQRLVLRMNSTGGPLETLDSIQSLCRDNRGGCEVLFQVSSPEGWATIIRSRSGLAVDPTDDLLAQLRAVPGVDDLVCRGV
ncbi:MAG: hypothetical protein JXO22_03075, partial [Phycisphaerae bacterium]|nr:hypothetical protein [Phycisphaerae bacterium]